MCDEAEDDIQPKSKSEKHIEQEETEGETESDCPDVEKEQFRCGQCGGRDELGNCKGNPKYDYKFKGCPCLEDLEFSQETPPQKRSYFGIGIAKMMRVPDFEYDTSPKTDNDTQVQLDPIGSDINEPKEAGEPTCPDLEIEHFRCSDCGGSDGFGKCKIQNENINIRDANV
ncbi:hypothetical protein IFR05_002927 [Cadophora sp. M221]|nr:hypothetical protein IFR05_002927 [Cadophora sp. M221]